MKHIALTGNIASGKTTVANLFRLWGATVIDADALVREAQTPGSPVLAAIAERFGAGGVVDLLAACGYYVAVAMALNVSRVPLPDGVAPLGPLPGRGGA